MASVTIRGKLTKLPSDVGASKSDIARYLLGEGYSVSEVSKAIPAAYSQVHSIWKKVPTAIPVVDLQTDHRFKPPKTTAEKASVKATRAADASAQRILRRERTAEAEGRPAGPKLNPRIGKLRTGGLPRDIDAGVCANCGFDLIVRGTPVGYVLVHVNATAEEYLRTIQFCQAVPAKLLGK